MARRIVKIEDTVSMATSPPAVVSCKATLLASAEEDLEARRETYAGEECTLDQTGGVSEIPGLPAVAQALLAGIGFSVRTKGKVEFTLEVDRFSYQEVTPPLIPARNHGTDCWASALATARNWGGWDLTLEKVRALGPSRQGEALSGDYLAYVAASLQMATMPWTDLSDPRRLLRLLKDHGPMVVVIAPPLGLTPGLAHAVVVYGVQGDGTAKGSSVDVADPSLGLGPWPYAIFLELYSTTTGKHGDLNLAGPRIAYFPQRAGKRRPPPYLVLEAHGKGTLTLTGTGELQIPPELAALVGALPLSSGGTHCLSIDVRMTGGNSNKPDHRVTVALSFGPYPASLAGTATLEE
jgi:hypothetical protein